METGSGLGQLECAVCGASLGMGLPGNQYCSRCGQYVIGRAVQGNTAAVIGAVIAVGLGLLAAYLISRS